MVTIVLVGVASLLPTAIKLTAPMRGSLVYGKYMFGLSGGFFMMPCMGSFRKNGTTIIRHHNAIH